MADNAVLSQREIDALLNADLSHVDDEEHAPTRQGPAREGGSRIKSYDFRHPEKLSKEQLRGLQIIQQGVANTMAQALSTRLRAPVEAKLGALERSIYEEYTSQVGQNAVVVIIDMAPLQGYAIASFGVDIAFTILDRLLGGRGRVNNLAQNRDLTDIEVALVRHIGMDIANSLVDPWTRVAELTPEISELAVGPQVVHVVPPSEFVITAWYEVKVAEHIGSVSVCFPLTILEQVIPNLSGQTLFDTRARSGEGADQVIRQDQLHPVNVLLRAMLGNTTVGASELAGIQEGDVLPLDARVDEPLRVIVGNVERFAGYPGTRGKKLAVQVSGLVDDDGFVLPFHEDGSA